MSKTTRNTRRDVNSFSGDITVGIDTHKKDYHICLWSVQEDCKIEGWVQPPDTKALMRKLEPIRSRVIQIVYEAGPIGFSLARQLNKSGWPAIVTSPGDIPTSRNEAKSDRRDAQRLARLSARRLLHPIHVLTEKHDQERQIQRQRNQFLKNRKQSQIRIKSFLLYSGVTLPDDFTWSEKIVAALPGLVHSVDQQLTLEYYIESYKLCCVMVEKADTRLRQVQKRGHNKKTISHLCTIGGIAERTALEFILEMGPADRFETRQQVAKYQGLAPDVRSSGQSRKEGPTNNSGNRRLKTLLVEAAWRWRRFDDDAKNHYNRMLSNTGCPQKAITALAHRLGIVMWSIMAQQVDYIPGGTRKKSEAEDKKKTTRTKSPAKAQPAQQPRL